MDPSAEQHHRIRRSPQRWADDVAAALRASPPGRGVRLLDVRGAVEQHRPVLLVTYRLPGALGGTGLRRWLDGRAHPPAPAGHDPAAWLAAAIARHDLTRLPGTYPDEAATDPQEVWWWGDAPLPGRGPDGAPDGAAAPAVHPGGHRPVHERSWRLRVDGQDFEVGVRSGPPWTYDVEWLSGPHPYGFSSSGPAEMGVDEVREAVRNFLAGIDPRTGHLR